MEDDRKCRDINECERDSPCEHICENTDGRSAHHIHEIQLEYLIFTLFPIPLHSCSFICKCFNGFELSDDEEATRCFDVDECRRGTHECSHECINEEGSYRCACPKTLLLHSDAKRCDHKNLCAFENGGCSQLCEFYHNRTICSCRKGFEVDKVDDTKCNDIDECKYEHK